MNCRQNLPHASALTPAVELEAGTATRPVPTTATDAIPAPQAGEALGAVTVWTADVAVVCVTDDLDRAALSRLRERCRAEMEAGAITVVVDFAEMNSCCSAVFLTLQQIDAVLRSGGARLCLMSFEPALGRAVGVADQV